jgi:hypothetical protein
MHIGNALMWQCHQELAQHELHILPKWACDNDDMLLFYTYPLGYHEAGRVAPNCTASPPMMAASNNT